jgi:pimeloyl-ACP methyl ester carboxylesterase
MWSVLSVAVLTASLVTGAPAPGLFDHPCPGHPDYECGSLSVPMDYSRPWGPKLTITVSRMKATGPHRQGVIVYNPGGPGSSGLYKADILPASVRQDYDYIGFDPRGVGASSPLSCVDGSFFASPAADPNPASEADKARIRLRARQYAAGCASRGGAELPYLTTPNTARDIDEIRKALGERQINYYGSSYGTYLGAVYGQLFPQRVRRMVLDSNADASPENVWYQGNLDQDVAFQDRAEQWFGWIAQYDNVFHLGRTESDVYASYLRARAQLKAEPVDVLGPDELDAVIVNSVYFDTNWVSNTQAVSDYLVQGDAAALLAEARDADPTSAAAENANAAYTAVSCNDAPWPRSWTRWDRDNSLYAVKAPIETWANVALNLPCAYWPVASQQPMKITGRGLPPILMLQGTLDGATPYEGALRTHRLLPSSHLVVEQGGGSHGLYNRPQVHNACVDGYATDYLLTGKIPAGDVVCPGHALPVP